MCQYVTRPQRRSIGKNSAVKKQIKTDAITLIRLTYVSKWQKTRWFLVGAALIYMETVPAGGSIMSADLKEPPDSYKHFYEKKCMYKNNGSSHIMR